MSRQRFLLWFGLLALVIGIRWWDPMARPKSVEPASAPVERTNQSVAISPSQADTASAVLASAWPVRSAIKEDDAGNAFLARGQVPVPVVKQLVIAAPAPVAYALPPPPPPVEIPPPLQIIGTWGDDTNMGVFLAGPQGTVLARPGDMVLSDYRVQSITKQQLTLQQNSNQRSWTLAIPSAPSTLQTWPGR